MANGNPNDVDKALHGMSDQQAIDIMEGRAQPHDSPEAERAARAIANGLEGEELDDSVHGGGAAVTPFPPSPPRKRQPQPWLRMAAALLLGVIITSIVAPPQLVTTVERPGISSANVVLLETYRSAAADSLTIVSLSDADPWLTLQAYPDFAGAERLHVFVERAAVDIVTVAAAQRSQDWSVIMEDAAGVGTLDSIVVNVPTALFQPGIHRLRIESEGADAKITASTAVMFLVSN